MSRWNPAEYARFSGLRLRPALDLLAQVPPALPPGAVVDLGCGTGAVAPALRARFPDRALLGLDGSAEMLAQAEGHDRLIEGDIASWLPEAPPALIFSNAALQWLADHDALFPRLSRLLAPGGVLAVQMPVNHAAPSHARIGQIMREMFPGRHAAALGAVRVAEPRHYRDLLAEHGPVLLWETEYFQELPPAEEGHPVRHFTRSTAMLPWLEALSAPEQAAFLARYDAQMLEDYPLLPGGGALFPFRRFFLLHIRAG